MSKLQDIRELAQEHATSVSSSPRDWMGYMDTAARLYRYPFTDQLLIHAQHPQATACASLELWNEKMFRWVNRGARGIALLNENGHNTRLRYVFDISDTHMVAGGRSPYLWQMQEHQQEEILTHLAEAYGLEEKDTGTIKTACATSAATNPKGLSVMRSFLAFKGVAVFFSSAIAYFLALGVFQLQGKTDARDIGFLQRLHHVDDFAVIDVFVGSNDNGCGLKRALRFDAFNKGSYRHGH